MAGYRQFHTKFWKDEWLIDLEPLERYLFTYLFTNDLSSISGIYKLPYKVILNETGLEPEFIDRTLKKFEDAKKVLYRDGVMWVVKMGQHHKNASPKTMTKVYADVALIGDCQVKRAYQYYQETGIYCIDTVSIPILKRESEKEIEKVDTASSPNLAALSPDTIALSVYTGVTGFMAYPGGMEKNATKLWQFARSHGGIAQAVEYLKPFYTTWTGRKTKDGRAYSRTGDGWIDWAIAGECPPETVKPEDKPLSGRESRRAMLKY